MDSDAEHYGTFDLQDDSSLIKNGAFKPSQVLMLGRICQTTGQTCDVSRKAWSQVA